MSRPSRREFLALIPGVYLAVESGARAQPRCPHWDMRTPGPHPHPEPRPGIDASNVLTDEDLGADPHVKPIYEGIRSIPEVADGIRCYCGCAEIPGYYSLLTCYEGGGMARYCEICQGQGRLVFRLHNRGKTLDEIRKLVTARYG